jgi:DNA-binding MarR family transcriptional regulator
MAVNRVTNGHDAVPGAVADDVRADIGDFLQLFVSLVTGLKRGRHEVPDTLRELFEGGGLGPRHVPVLTTVAFGGPLSVGEIAERIGLSLATTSLMVGELDRHGVVVRAEDPHDRRRTIVRLHDDHRAIVDAWTQERFSPIARGFTRMSPTVRKHFMDGMRTLVDEAQASARED